MNILNKYIKFNSMIKIIFHIYFLLYLIITLLIVKYYFNQENAIEIGFVIFLIFYMLDFYIVQNIVKPKLYINWIKKNLNNELDNENVKIIFNSILSNFRKMLAYKLTYSPKNILENISNEFNIIYNNNTLDFLDEDNKKYEKSTTWNFFYYYLNYIGYIMIILILIIFFFV